MFYSFSQTTNWSNSRSASNQIVVELENALLARADPEYLNNNFMSYWKRQSGSIKLGDAGVTGSASTFGAELKCYFFVGRQARTADKCNNLLTKLVSLCNYFLLSPQIIHLSNSWLATIMMIRSGSMYNYRFFFTTIILSISWQAVLSF